MEEQDKKSPVKLRCGRKFRILIISFLLLMVAILFVTVFYKLKPNNTKINLSVQINNNQSLSENKSELINEVEFEENEYILIFGGDVMLGRHVQQLQEKNGGYLSAWENIASEFSTADLAIINLESPFSDRLPYPTEGFVFKAKPKNIDGLLVAGIDVVHLANNHFGNAGVYGMNYTFDILKENNIEYVGAGKNLLEAYQSKIIKIDDLSIGLVGQGYNVSWYRAGRDTPGIAVLDQEKLSVEIENLKEQKADIIIAMFHGGVEYITKPNQDQILFAHTAVEAGADLVVGHHPHWVQEIEEYQDKYIFYSLGNLIFDQNWSKETSRGLVLQVNITNKKIIGYELKPVVIENNFKPRWADENESQEILENIDYDSIIIEL